jgi:hypothetical protein
MLITADNLVLWLFDEGFREGWEHVKDILVGGTARSKQEMEGVLEVLEGWVHNGI